MQGTTVYQRTENGRAEIRNKSHGLTQSERQALIMVDGATSCDGLAQKLARLSGQRLQQILLKLERSGLIAELLLVPESIQPEQLDRDEIDRFLQQDELDPVTIISFDPDEDFSLDHAEPATPVAASPGVDLDSWIARPAPASPTPLAPAAVEAAGGPDPVRVDPYLPQGWSQASSAPQPPSPIMTPVQAPSGSARRRPGWLSWEYWFIGVGLLLIILPLLLPYLN